MSDRTFDVAGVIWLFSWTLSIPLGYAVVARRLHPALLLQAAAVPPLLGALAFSVVIKASSSNHDASSPLIAIVLLTPSGCFSFLLACAGMWLQFRHSSFRPTGIAIVIAASLVVYNAVIGTAIFFAFAVDPRSSAW